MLSTQEFLTRAYEAFNSRDIEATLAYLHPDVEWPDVAQGLYLRGIDSVRDYWTRQFAVTNSQLEARGFSQEDDQKVAVEVHMVAKDLEGNLLLEQDVIHVFTLQDDLLKRLDVRQR